MVPAPDILRNLETSQRHPSLKHVFWYHSVWIEERKDNRVYKTNCRPNCYTLISADGLCVFCMVVVGGVLVVGKNNEEKGLDK